MSPDLIHALQNKSILYSRVLITITYAVKICNIHLTRTLRSLIISECLVRSGLLIISSVMNLGSQAKIR